MKKLICSFCVLVVAFGLFASAAPSLGDGRSWIPESVLIGTGNDKWTFGLSRNNDDQLSYSGNIRVEAPVWTLSLDLNGFTNRGWKDKWYTDTEDPNPGHWYNGRYDTIDLAFALRWSPFSTDHWQMEVSPRVGFLMAGNYGFVWFQNLIHKISHIHSVSLPYEPGSYFAPKASAKISFSGFWGLPTERSKTTNFGARVSFDTENNIGFETSQYVGMDLFLQRDREQLLSVSLGYIWYQQHTDWKTQKLALWSAQGLRLGFQINAGALSVDYWYAMQGAFGYTRYYIDVMSFFQKSNWSENDLIITLATSRIFEQNYHTLEFQKQLFGSRWSLLSTNRYIAGNPVDKKDEASDDPNKFARLKLAFSLWTVGVKYEFPDQWSKGWCTPFASLGLGMERFEFAILDNMIQEDKLPWWTLAEYAFIVDAEIGVSLFPSGMIKAGNASYRLILSGGLTWIPAAKDISAMIVLSRLSKYYDEEDLERVYYFLPRFTVGVQIGFDL